MKSLPGVNLSKWDFTFLLRAQRASLSSKDPRRQVGAVVVYPDNTTAGDGFNGLAPGVDDARIDDREFKNNCVLHAEENALLSCKGDVAGSTLYVWGLTPCGHCAAVAIRRKVKRIVGVYGPGGDSWAKSLDHASIEMRDANVKFECLDMDQFDELMKWYQPELHMRHWPHEYGLPKFWPGNVDPDAKATEKVRVVAETPDHIDLEQANPRFHPLTEADFNAALTKARADSAVIAGPLNAVASAFSASLTAEADPSRVLSSHSVEVVNGLRMYCSRLVLMPTRANPTDSGLDLRADIHDARNDVVLGKHLIVPPGETRTIPTGVYVAVLPGLEVQVRSRSGLAAKHGVHVLNSPGTVDSSYRGEIKVILHNTGETEFIVHDCDRIAQMVVTPVVLDEFQQVDSVDALGCSARGAGGFGSTGVR